MSVEPSTASSRLDPEPVPRRDFLGLAAIVSAISAGVVAVVGMLRLPQAAVLPSPSKRFSVQIPESLAPGVALEVPNRNVAIFRDQEGVYAISKVCTHLGCIVKSDPQGFHCPCHGSHFTPSGEVTKGPAPSALPWLKVTESSEGVFVIDEDSPVGVGTKVTA